MVSRLNAADILEKTRQVRESKREEDLKFVKNLIDFRKIDKTISDAANRGQIYTRIDIPKECFNSCLLSEIWVKTIGKEYEKRGFELRRSKLDHAVIIISWEN